MRGWSRQRDASTRCCIGPAIRQISELGGWTWRNPCHPQTKTADRPKDVLSRSANYLIIPRTAAPEFSQKGAAITRAGFIERFSRRGRQDRRTRRRHRPLGRSGWSHRKRLRRCAGRMPSRANPARRSHLDRPNIRPANVQRAQFKINALFPTRCGAVALGRSSCPGRQRSPGCRIRRAYAAAICPGWTMVRAAPDRGNGWRRGTLSGQLRAPEGAVAGTLWRGAQFAQSA